jgi:hypothetical protein
MLWNWPWGALSFRVYIQTRRVTSTPVGDFVRDAKEDARLPDVGKRSLGPTFNAAP